MIDLLSFPNRCVSYCFTLNAQEAEKKEFINRLSSLFLQIIGLLLFQVLVWMLWKWISHCRNWRPVYLFPQILWTNTTSVNSYHQSIWHMSVWNFYFWPCFRDNVIVKEYSMSKDKVSYYINYGIAPVFREDMFLTCVKWPFHSVLFSGSFCHIFRDNGLDLYIRILDCVKC